MENENATIKLVEELVNAQDNVSELRAIRSELTINYRRVSNELDRLIETIIENTKLDYNDRDLTIDNETAILQLVKFLAPDSYEDRRLTLRRDKVEETEESKSKEARKNGK